MDIYCVKDRQVTANVEGTETIVPAKNKLKNALRSSVPSTVQKKKLGFYRETDWALSCGKHWTIT